MARRAVENRVRRLPSVQRQAARRRAELGVIATYLHELKLLGDRNWYLPSWLGWLPRSRYAPRPSPQPAGADA
jgi:hypothetical protein